MNMELRAQGASFIAGKSDQNPRDLVIESLKVMPEAARKDVFDHFRSALHEAGEDYQRSVEWYFFVNMYDYLTTNRTRPKNPVERAEARVAQREVVERIKAQIIMLDLTMPNGKPMRDCTGGEMARFGNRFQKIAERVGKSKLVGSVLSEEQVRAVMR